MPYLTVGETAELLCVSPKVLSDALYRRTIDVRRCPLQAGRRLIPRDYVPTIAAVLKRRGVEISEPK